MLPAPMPRRPSCLRLAPRIVAICAPLVACSAEPRAAKSPDQTSPTASTMATSSASSSGAPAASGADAASRPQRALVKTRVEPVVDDFFGEKIADPYRWLEDGDAPAVKAWTAEQNARTRAALDGDPRRAKLHARLDELLSIGFVSGPTVRTDGKRVRRYFHYRREGTMDQPVLFVREGLDGKDRPLLDPTTFGGADATTAIDWAYLSRDGLLVAYGVSTSGDEQSTLRVRDVATGKDLPDVITRTRGTSLAWTLDGKGFWYTREPDPKTVPKGEEHYHRRVFFHALGADPEKDAQVFPAPGQPEKDMTHVPTIELAPSGRWLIVRVHQGWAKSSVFLKALPDPKAKAAAKPAKDAKEAKPIAESPWVTLVDGPDALFDPIAHRDEKGKDALFVRTNDGAPNFRIFRVDPLQPARERWQEIVPEAKAMLRDFDLVGGSLFVGRLERAVTKVSRHDLSGKKLEDFPVGPLATAQVPHGEPEGDEVLWEEQSFVTPPSIYRRTIKGKEGKPATPTLFGTVASTIDGSKYEVEQIEAVSKDGTIVTAFVVHQKGLARDGKAPALLGGYGGFNIPQLPAFNRTVYALLERGGVYVLSNLRGGSEYGEAWHRAGMLDQKQHVFDDQIAVAERLFALGITSKERLAITGGSNGGLLVGALVTQRPDLFRAALCNVPLLDMLRYERFLIAKLWIPEYGSAQDPKQFAWLRAYSPYQRVVDGTPYPATLFLTAESDSRVDPLHARKMAARLQAATSSTRPILLRVESKAGHGAGKPRSKQIEDLADQYTFLFRELGIE
jgi:prolyl oligopeptidase